MKIKYRKKHFMHGFWTFSFWQCKGRPTRYELGPATWDLTCDLGGGTWELRLDPSRLTWDLTLATCKHLWHTHTHTHTFNGPFSGTTQVSRYQKGKTSLDFSEARDSEWQWHQLGHMQVCTCCRQTTTPAPHHSCFLQAGCPSCHPTNSVKALKYNILINPVYI